MYDSSKVKHAIILQSIFRYFPSEIIASATTTMLNCVNEHYDRTKDKILLFKELGLALIRSPPKKNEPKITYLNDSWKEMQKTEDSVIFLDCASVCVDFAIKNLKSDAVKVFIKEIFKKL